MTLAYHILASQVASFSIYNALQSEVWSQMSLIRHPGLEAQVNVGCHKTKLVHNCQLLSV